MILYLDPGGGMAGDMFSAALISAGAKETEVIDIMQYAASALGSSKISVLTTDDGASQLKINLNSRSAHLSESKAVDVLKHSFTKFLIPLEYRDFGYQILNILFEAEKKAHARYNIIMDSDSRHHHHSDKESLLHEAQDIIIDITGAVMGLRHLKINLSSVYQINPVATGGGTVDFSHGVFPVPAPATEEILNTYNISCSTGPIDQELCTPTGAAIFAALNPAIKPSPDSEPVSIGLARGSKILDIPPLKIFICNE